MLDTINTPATITANDDKHIIRAARTEAAIVVRRAAESGFMIHGYEVYLVLNDGDLVGFHNLSHAKDRVCEHGGAIYRLWRDELQRFV